jgi:hypothetical protein
MKISEHFPPLYRAELVAASKLPDHAELIARIDSITDRMARDGYVRERSSDTRMALLESQCARFGALLPHRVL